MRIAHPKSCFSEGVGHTQRSVTDLLRQGNLRSFCVNLGGWHTNILSWPDCTYLRQLPMARLTVVTTRNWDKNIVFSSRDRHFYGDSNQDISCTKLIHWPGSGRRNIEQLKVDLTC